MPIQSVMPSSHLILCCPLLLLPPIPPSIRVFSNELTLRMRWPKYWSFSFNISPFNENPGLISFRMDLLDLLAVQAILMSLFSNTTVQKHQFFGTQLSSQSQLPHPYMTTEKTIALTRWTFVGKVMSLLFNKLSRLVITFFPRSKRLLISWLQSPSAWNSWNKEPHICYRKYSPGLLTVILRFGIQTTKFLYAENAKMSSMAQVEILLDVYWVFLFVVRT